MLVRPPTAGLREPQAPADPVIVRRHASPLVLALALLVTAATSLIAAPHARAAYPASFARVAHNPADALLSLPIERFAYDPATHCVKRPTAGALALQAWLGRHVRGVSWGIMRCELWGKRSASLHAEGRAVDWHLDVHRPADARAAQRLISELLAPDAGGRPAALARRMGVQEIIFDCRSWFGGTPAMTHYSACHGKRTDDTTAHRNHVHLGLSRPGAKKRTSFWTRHAPPPALREG